MKLSPLFTGAALVVGVVTGFICITLQLRLNNRPEKIPAPDAIFRPTLDVTVRPPPDVAVRPSPDVTVRPPPDVILRPPPDVISCDPKVVYRYNDTVDFRIIVLTYNRPDSLLKLLNTLNNLIMDNDTASLEIFIDRGKSNIVHNQTVEAAKNFRWKINGPKRVYVWKEHVSLRGNWIYSWRPMQDSKEIALILEDDLSVSPFAYRWLKAAHTWYGTRNDIQGYTLTSGQIQGHGIGGKAIIIDKSDSAYLYKVPGSHGFSPNPRVWSAFQDWFQVTVTNKTFHPYVPNTKLTTWYKNFEKRGMQDTMWTMWFVWFTDKHNLYCLYNNIHKIPGVKKNYYLVEHRHEPGVHSSMKGATKADKLLLSWNKVYQKFPKNTKKVDYMGMIKG